jgi:hypothetical protein
MAKQRRHGSHSKGRPATPKGTPPVGVPAGAWSIREREPDLMRDVAHALRSGDPLALLVQVSSLLTLVDPREYGFGRRAGEPPWSPREMADMFIDVDRVETSALLAVIGELAGDEVLAARIRRELARRADRRPEWLDRLREAEVYAAREMVHVLGDGDSVHIAVRLAGGAEFAAVVYIDHNLGALVKDAFVVSQPMAELEVFMRDQLGDPDTTWRDLELADARVRITHAIERAATTVPAFESETWPACRALLEWLIRRMPAGGVAYEPPVWSEKDQRRLADRFFASPFGLRLDDSEHRQLLRSLIWFGTDYGPGDPLRWSPAAVEIILVDWIPRKVVADAAFLSEAPDLLRAFIQFCHAERGIRPELTEDTLAAVDLYELDYQRAISSPGPEGAMALLAAMGDLDPDAPWVTDDFDDGFDFDSRSYMRDYLREAAGGDDALRALDDRPLPDEEFEWAGIPDDVHERVGEVVELTDACCDQLLDTEYRTACRRLLARAAAGDPAVFRRRARAVGAAGAVCWIVGKDNHLFNPAGGGMLVKDVAAHFGLAQSGVAQRAGALMKAAGFDPHAPRWDLRLGDPGLLVSGRRRRMIALRDRYFADD